MITNICYSDPWIKKVLSTCKSTNYGLAEKMIYAFTLLEQLAQQPFPFIFKGGTSMALLLPTLTRFSKDIDILTEERPKNLEHIFNKIIQDSPFTRWEPSFREPFFNVPKEHFKFYYNPKRPSRFKEEPILLDILYGKPSYPSIQQKAIKHSILTTTQPYHRVYVPTIEGITGEKLTAFAPRTLGIPFGKNKSVEIMKQLYDLYHLSNFCTDWGSVASSFLNSTAIIVNYYELQITPSDVVDDIIQTAHILGMQGREETVHFKEMKRGMEGLNNYLLNDSFRLPDAIIASAKIARLALSLIHDLDFEPVVFNNTKLRKFNALNKPLKKAYTKAWYEWLHIEKIMEQKSKSN